MSLENNNNSIIKFVINHFWLMIIFINIIIITLTYVLQGTAGLQALVAWFKSVSFEQNSNFVTISTVLIGIYFSLYTYILSADASSFFSRLTVKEFKKLILMITIGFCSSMLIVILSFLNDILYKYMDLMYIGVLYLLFVLIFGSLIQISVYYSLIFKYDLNSRYETFNQERIESEENRVIKEKLKEFLEKNND